MQMSSPLKNVAVATQAIAAHLKSTRRTKKGVIVGYDPRFSGGMILQNWPVKCWQATGSGRFLCVRDTPTPVIAYEQISPQT